MILEAYNEPFITEKRQFMLAQVPFDMFFLLTIGLSLYL